MDDLLNESCRFDAPEDALKGSRIIVLVARSEAGTDEQQAIMLARYLAEAEQANIEIWIDKKSGLQQTSKMAELPVRFINMPLPWAASPIKQAIRLLRFAWTLRRARPDIILPYGYLQSVVGG